ncbi:enoyl-CoA hydratase/carnithine racemase [Streptomyces collinus]
MSTEPTTIRWEQDDTGVVTLVLDDPDQSANTMNQAFRDSLAAVTDRLEAEKDSIRGVIVTSAKKTFFAGGDLRDLIRVTPPRRPRTSSTAAWPSSATSAASRPSASPSSPP